MVDDSGPFAGMPGIFVGAFGEPAAWIPSSTGATVALSAIFIEPFVLLGLDVDLSAGVDGSAPSVHVRADDVTGIAQGDGISARGRSFSVVDIQPDGKGMVRLSLHETD